VVLVAEGVAVATRRLEESETNATKKAEKLPLMRWRFRLHYLGIPFTIFTEGANSDRANITALSTKLLIKRKNKD
jgi:hypothetical protein